MCIALVVGHSSKNKGAKNKAFNVFEYDINKKLAIDIKDILGSKVEIVYRLNGYIQLPNDINKFNPNLILSLHCNAYNTKISGSEVLYYYKSECSKQIAQVFQSKIVNVLGLSDRGIKGKSSEDRGGYLLRYTNAPCLILEPCFLDNDSDFAVFMCKYDEYVKSISSIIEVYNNLI